MLHRRRSQVPFFVIFVIFRVYVCMYRAHAFFFVSNTFTFDLNPKMMLLLLLLHLNIDVFLIFSWLFMKNNPKRMIYFIYKWRMVFSRHELIFFCFGNWILQDPTTKIVDTVCLSMFFLSLNFYFLIFSPCTFQVLFKCLCLCACT